MRRQIHPITGFAYFILNRERGLVRIGFAADPRSRLAAMQTASPEKLELALVIPGDERVERALLNKFASCHVGNGWYEAARMVGVLFG